MPANTGTPVAAPSPRRGFLGRIFRVASFSTAAHVQSPDSLTPDRIRLYKNSEFRGRFLFFAGARFAARRKPVPGKHLRPSRAPM
jgi:hypothetical protein